MNKLHPVIFLIPVIALSIVVLFYLFLLKRESNKIAFKRFIFFTITFAFVLNLVWELAHLPLYQNNVYDALHLALCALASIADAIMVLLIYFSLALIYKNAFWIKDINIQRSLILIVIGGAGAVLAEIRHVSQGDWTYDSSMPIIPIVNVGLSPILQLMLLPLIIYCISLFIVKKLKSYN